MDLHVRDMTATIAADVTLGDVQTAMAEQNQWLPIDGDPSRPLGELIEHNSTGPLRLGYGAWRDLLLGVQFINHRDELITAGGRTVKNVAGYDLTKLMVGQHGQLGKIVTLTARTYRRPAGAVVATFPPNLSLVQDLLPTPLKPQWMLLSADALTCGYLGDDLALNFYRVKLAEAKPLSIHARTLAADIAERTERFRGGVRVSVPPTKVQEFVTAASLHGWIADPVFGIVLCDTADVEALRDIAKRVGGSVVTPAGQIEEPVLRRLQSAFGGKLS